MRWCKVMEEEVAAADGGEGAELCEVPADPFLRKGGVVGVVCKVGAAED